MESVRTVLDLSPLFMQKAEVFTLLFMLFLNPVPVQEGRDVGLVHEVGDEVLPPVWEE